MNINRVLITGVAGFIGSNLLDYLLDRTDWVITGIDNLSTGNLDNIKHRLEGEEFEFLQMECTELTSLRDYDVVFHMAALPRIQPSFVYLTDHLRANLTNGLHLVELMIRDEYYPRFVYSSSSSIYGTAETTPTNESEPIQCLNPYAFQKYELEKYLELLEDRYPLDYVNLRYFNPFGPRSYNPSNQFSAYSSVVGIFLNRRASNETLFVTGDGSQKRDFIHVYDVCEANYVAATHPETLNTAFNVGRGDTLSILNLARMISDDYEFVDSREGEADITFADIAKARDILGWEPTRKLEDYIAEQLAAARSES